jgi:arylsulfatase A-like enzyme
VKQPRQSAAGSIDRRLTSGVDVVPTALAALGVDAGDLPGHDLADSTWDRQVVVAESGSEGLMVRTGRHKVLERPGRRPVLFDLEADPLELDPREFEAIARSEARPAAFPNEDRRARFDAILDRDEHPWLQPR